MKENKRKSIIVITTIMVIVLIVSLILIKNGLSTKEKAVAYTDNKSLDYTVDLKQNDFYKESSLEGGNQYISKLIDTVNAKFKYNFDLDEDYTYTYNIVGVVNIVDDKTNRVIYTYSNDIVPNKSGRVKGALKIEENTEIKYAKYNELVKKFISSYDLSNVSATLTLRMNFGVNGISKSFAKSNSSVMDLDIPLGTNTIAIDTKYNLVNAEKTIPLATSMLPGKVSLNLGIIVLSLDIIAALLVYCYIKVNETEEDKYNNHLRKIVNNYDSYISKIEEDFNMEGYQMLKVEKFEDLLEIRDTMQLPIIMFENKENLSACFMIPTNAKILYFYSINVNQYALPRGRK